MSWLPAGTDLAAACGGLKRAQPWLCCLPCSAGMESLWVFPSLLGWRPCGLFLPFLFREGFLFPLLLSRPLKLPQSDPSSSAILPETAARVWVCAGLCRLCRLLGSYKQRHSSLHSFASTFGLNFSIQFQILSFGKVIETHLHHSGASVGKH